MARRVTDKEKKEILDSFKKGRTITEISNSFKFTANTITRQLKKFLTSNEFENLNKIKNKTLKKNEFINPQESLDISSESSDELKIDQRNESFTDELNNFYEISPLEEQYQFNKQKELVSKPLKKESLPKIVYMLIDSKVELDPKCLRDYPEWNFLPEDDQNRKTIELFSDQKNARKNCSKSQKVLKVPNPEVFLIASKILKSKGISRIIYEDALFIF